MAAKHNRSDRERRVGTADRYNLGMETMPTAAKFTSHAASSLPHTKGRLNHLKYQDDGAGYESDVDTPRAITPPTPAAWLTSGSPPGAKRPPSPRQAGGMLTCPTKDPEKFHRCCLVAQDSQVSLNDDPSMDRARCATALSTLSISSMGSVFSALSSFPETPALNHSSLLDHSQERGPSPKSAVAVVNHHQTPQRERPSSSQSSVDSDRTFTLSSLSSRSGSYGPSPDSTPKSSRSRDSPFVDPHKGPLLLHPDAPAVARDKPSHPPFWSSDPFSSGTPHAKSIYKYREDPSMNLPANLSDAVQLRAVIDDYAESVSLLKMASDQLIESLSNSPVACKSKIEGAMIATLRKSAALSSESMVLVSWFRDTKLTHGPIINEDKSVRVPPKSRTKSKQGHRQDYRVDSPMCHCPAGFCTCSLRFARPSTGASAIYFSQEGACSSSEDECLVRSSSCIPKLRFSKPPSDQKFGPGQSASLHRQTSCPLLSQSHSSKSPRFATPIHVPDLFGTPSKGLSCQRRGGNMNGKQPRSPTPLQFDRSTTASPTTTVLSRLRPPTPYPISPSRSFASFGTTARASISSHVTSAGRRGSKLFRSRSMNSSSTAANAKAHSPSAWYLAQVRSLARTDENGMVGRVCFPSLGPSPSPSPTASPSIPRVRDPDHTATALPCSPTKPKVREAATILHPLPDYHQSTDHFERLDAVGNYLIPDQHPGRKLSFLPQLDLPSSLDLSLDFSINRTKPHPPSASSACASASNLSLSGHAKKYRGLDAPQDSIVRASVSSAPLLSRFSSDMSVDDRRQFEQRPSNHSQIRFNPISMISGSGRTKLFKSKDPPTTAAVTVATTTKASNTPNTAGIRRPSINSFFRYLT